MECSMHFQTTWAREGGARMASHDTAVLWLWQVHNLVSNRVSAERRQQVRKLFVSRLGSSLDV